MEHDRGMTAMFTVFTWPELGGIVGGDWLVPPPVSVPGVVAVEDDSRQVRPGGLFVAIPGESCDGHDFVLRAVDAGAAAVCVSRVLAGGMVERLRASGCGCLRVPDTLVAFQQLARAHRLRFAGLTMVAVTGSSGKTSTKEMMAAIFEQRWPGAVLKTLGNTNNHFGVPRNLLRLSAAHRAALLELGSNHPGEIAALTALVLPDVGVVCNIGRAHIEFFGSLAGTAAEKGAILAGTQPSGVAVYPFEAAHAEVLRACAGARRCLTFGSAAAADVQVAYHGCVDGGYGIGLRCGASGVWRQFVWPVGGRHQALNAAAAAAVAMALGIDMDTVVCGLRTVQLPKMRMERRECGGVHWVNDAYNANPDSVRASIDWFGELTAGPPAAAARLVVLGDMLELGGESERAHREALRHAADVLPGAEIIGVGPLMCRVGAGCGVRTFADADAARGHVTARVCAGHWVLLKGSNAIGLHRMVPE